MFCPVRDAGLLSESGPVKPGQTKSSRFDSRFSSIGFLGSPIKVNQGSQFTAFSSIGILRSPVESLQVTQIDSDFIILHS